MTAWLIGGGIVVALCYLLVFGLCLAAKQGDKRLREYHLMKKALDREEQGNLHRGGV